MKRTSPRAASPARGHGEPIVGMTPAAERLRRAVGAAVAGTGHLIVTGEPGTGKRFLAHHIHERTPLPPRSPFIEISPRMAEAELRVLLFEEDRPRHEGVLGRSIPRLVRGGTLFVRNIHECGFLAQSRVARFLIEHEAPAPRPGAVRVIFSLPGSWESIAAPRPVNETLNAYFRRFEQISIPPLRERRDDIPLFVDYFLRRLSAGTPPEPDDRIMAELVSLPYYDNVRELRHLVAEALAVSRNGVFTLPGGLRDEPAAVQAFLRGILRGRRSDLGPVLQALEKALIRRALLRCDFDRSAAAALLGLSEMNLRYRLRKFGMNGTERAPARSSVRRTGSRSRS